MAKRPPRHLCPTSLIISKPFTLHNTGTRYERALNHVMACSSSPNEQYKNMDGRCWGELAMVLVSVCLFVGYHIWMYYLQLRLRPHKSTWFNVYRTAGLTRLLWTHAILSDEKDAITGVQTLRNAIMVCALFATASAYVGGRALPSILFDPTWRNTLEAIAVRRQQSPCTSSLYAF